jgi:hypothetical protein
MLWHPCRLCRSLVPEPLRHGTRLVFRQGSPLVPADLQLVAASRAGATIIVSDLSRPADEADSQVIRWGPAGARRR